MHATFVSLSLFILLLACLIHAAPASASPIVHQVEIQVAAPLEVRNEVVARGLPDINIVGRGRGSGYNTKIPTARLLARNRGRGYQAVAAPVGTAKMAAREVSDEEERFADAE